MFVLQTAQDAIRTRLRVFANMIPRDVDMLMAVGDVKHSGVLLDLADRIRGMLSHTDGEFARQENLDGLDEALLGSPLRLSTMGRGLDGDAAYFLAAAAAGRHAARLIS